MDTHGFCGWTTDEMVEHVDGQDKKDWTGVSGGPGSQKQTEKLIDRKTNRQKDKQTERQTNRHKDKPIDRKTN